MTVLHRPYAIALFLSVISTGMSVAQEQSDPVIYSASMAGAGAFWALRVNDVTVWRDFEGVDTNLVLPVNTFLHEGENTVDVTFVSVAGSPIEHNVYSPDYHFWAELRRMDQATQAQDRMTVLNLGLEEADNSVTFPPATKSGQQIDPSPLVQSGGIDAARLVSGWGDDWAARRVSAVVRIDDPLPAPPWADAPVMEDTPETRTRMLDAYHELHAVIAAGDEADLHAAYAPAWAHIARAMSYTSVEEYLERVAPIADLAPSDAEGRVLQPVDLVMGEQAFQIERMAGGRLARIVPDPIIWVSPDDPDSIRSTNVAFFVGPDGELQVGAVLY